MVVDDEKLGSASGMRGADGDGDGEGDGNLKAKATRSWMSCKKSGSRCGWEQRRCHSHEQAQHQATQKLQRLQTNESNTTTTSSSIFSRISSRSRSTFKCNSCSPSIKEREITPSTTSSSREKVRKPSPTNAEMQGRLDRLEKMIALLQKRYCPKDDEDAEKKDCDTPMLSIETDDDARSWGRKSRESQRDGRKSDTSTRTGTSWREVMGIM